MRRREGAVTLGGAQVSRPASPTSGWAQSQAPAGWSQLPLLENPGRHGA